MWQDYALAATQVVLTIGFIPMIFQKDKPTLWSSITASIGMAVIALIMSTLGLWLSATMSAIASALWFVLVYQKISHQRLNK